MSVHEVRGPAAVRGVLLDWIRFGALQAAGEPLLAAVAETAADEGLAGLLAGARFSWPPAVRARLESSRQAALFVGVQQLDTLAWAMDLLERQGHRALPLKGGALAEDLYVSPADRPMCDVDLLVLDDPAGAERILRAEGLVPIDRADHAVALRTATGVVLELHASATSCPGLFALDAEALWARRREGAGQVKRLPAREDLLVLLALHAAFQHGLALRLVQFVDFKRLLAAPLDSALVLRIAGEMGARRALATALQAAEAMVAAHVPAPLRVALESAPRARVAAWCAEAAAGHAPPLARMRWMLARGRRRTLLAATLRGGEQSGLRRAATLARRWTLPTLRSWWPRRSAA